MRNSHGGDLVLERKVESAPCAVAEAQYPHLGDALGLQSREDFADLRFCDVEAVPAKPAAKVEGSSGIQSIRRNWIVKDIRHDDLETIASEVVR